VLLPETGGEIAGDLLIPPVAPIDGARSGHYSLSAARAE
jgi:hypothetical protein